MLFALVAGSTEPANCGLATVVMWICGSYCEWNKHHEEEARPHFCCSVLFSSSLHPSGYIQEGQEASYDYLLLGVYHRNSPGCTEMVAMSFRIPSKTQFVPSTLLISSYFWAKTFFFSRLSWDYPIIFSFIEVCTEGAYAFCLSYLALEHGFSSKFRFFVGWRN